MVSGRPNTQGGLTPITDPAHFPSSFASLQKKMQPDVKLRVAGGNATSEAISVGNVEGFTIYTNGGTVDVEVSPNNTLWVKISTITNAGVYSTTSFHNFVRTKVTAGDPEIWIYRKFATY
jgi:hypothetical protein